MLTLLGNIRAQISMLVGLRVFKKHYTPTGERDQGCGLGTKAKNKELHKNCQIKYAFARSLRGFLRSRDIYRTVLVTVVRLQWC